MSSGQYVMSRYESVMLSGLILPARVQPETRGLILGGAANDPPPGAVNLPLRVNVDGGRHSLGVKPNKVLLQWTYDPPPGYASGVTLSVVILRQALFDALDPGAMTGVYLGAFVNVVGVVPEMVL